MSQGQIIKIHSDFYYVSFNHETFECKLREVLKKQQEKVLVGDFVEFENGFIQKILPRKNYIPHPAVANIDQIVIVSAVEEPHLDYHQLDRYIAFAEYYKLNIKLCFNKNDLSLDDKTIEQVFSTYQPLGYDIVFTSALEKMGIEDFKEVMDGKISVLCGSSGVGKSSLLNSLNSNLQLRVKDISDKTKRGTHTTRHCEIMSISDNTKIIDTPGFSNLKFDFLLPIKIGNLFKEIKPFIGTCKFQDCLHIQETGCNVIEHLSEIPKTRYESYLAFVEEAKTYKEKIKYEGKKKETFKKQDNDKTRVKISAQKRLASRRVQKQNIYKEDLDEGID